MPIKQEEKEQKQDQIDNELADNNKKFEKIVVETRTGLINQNIVLPIIQYSFEWGIDPDVIIDSIKSMVEFQIQVILKEFDKKEEVKK